MQYCCTSTITGDCSALSNPVNGMVQMTGDIQGSMATYSCNNGFTLMGQNTRMCDNKMWTGNPPVCQGICQDISRYSVMIIVFSRAHIKFVKTFMCL